MSLTACRECEQKDGIDYGSPVTYLIIIATVAVLATGYFAYQHFAAGVNADGKQVEATIVDRFGAINPHITIYATCPSTVRLRKDKIVDCSIERSDNGKQTAVFIEGSDNDGHFHMQLEDPSILVDRP